MFHLFTGRHYEVVYLIHEKYEEDVGSVNEKVQGDFLPPVFLFFPHFCWSKFYERSLVKIGLLVVLYWSLFGFLHLACWSSIKMRSDLDSNILRLVLQKSQYLLFLCWNFQGLLTFGNLLLTTFIMLLLAWTSASS